MRHIDEPRLERDLAYRFEYLCDFTGFGPEDIAAITGAAGLLAPKVPGLVDAVYDKLFGYDATKRHFMPRQAGYDGELPTDLAALGHDHPLIAFRKSHLAKYLTKLVTGPYDGAMVRYLDQVGRIHTPHAGAATISVPLVQMNALLGFVADALVATIVSFALPPDVQARTLRAFTKLLWLQNDLISRHYASR